MVMEDCNDVNHFIANFEVDGIRKPVKQCSANGIPDLRKLERHLHNPLHYRVEFHQQIRTKSGALFFVPSNSIQDIEISLVP